MKKTIFLLSLLLSAALFSAEPLVWNKSNNFKGWDSAVAAKKQIADGIMILSSIKFDCRIVNRNVDFDPEQYNTFTFTYRASGGPKKKGELFFCHAGEGFSDKRRWDTPSLIADGQWHTVSITPAVRSSWCKGGNIKALRFDPTNSAGGKIEIKEIRLEKSDPVKKKLTAEIDAPLWPRIKPELWGRGKGEKKTEHYFQGKMIRSPEDKLSGGKYKEFYLRKVFFLKEKPLHGFLQYTADDCAEAFVNGRAAGSSNNWKSCVTLDVSPFLQKGKNILAFHYINEDTYGGVLAELYLQYTDGRVERIHTDKTFKSSSEAKENWNAVSFNDPDWLTAVEQAPPPAPPWRITLPYRYYQNMQKITAVRLSPTRVAAGKPVKASFICRGKVPEKDLKGTLILKQNSRNILSEAFQIPAGKFRSGKNGTWHFDLTFKAPLYLKTGRFSLAVETDIFSAQPERWPQLSFETEGIRNDPVFPVRNICKVVRKNGESRIELNGRPFYASWLGVPDNFLYMPLPVNLVTIGAERSHLWPRTGEFHPEALDIAAEKMHRRFPKAFFMWNISLVVPRDWPEKFPGEMTLNQQGKQIKYGYPPHSYSSQAAQKHFLEIIERTIRHLENSPYANRIIGYRFSGGYTGEFLGWEPAGSALDFSVCGKAAFAEFVKKHYPGLDTKVPTREERRRKESALLWDLKKNQRTVAYQEFTSRQLMDFLLPLCRKIRSLIGREKLLGIYYGYTSTLHHPGNSQYRAYYDLKRLLDAKVVDYLMSPQSYVLRNLGEFCGEMKPFRTLQNNNVISVCEDDSRTHCGYYTGPHDGASQTKTEIHTLAVARRNMGFAACRMSPGYYYPLVGGASVSFPAMMKEIAVQRTVGQHCLDVNAARKAQIALVVSEETIKAMPNLSGFTAPSRIIDQFYNADGSVWMRPRIKNIINYETFVGNQDRFTRSGAPVDQLLAEDLADAPGDYKLYVFLNCYKFDEKFLNALRQLRRRKCVLLWLYAPGFWKGLSSGTDNMKQLTGLDFEMLFNTAPAVKLKDGRLMGTPDVKISPVFAVKTPGAEILGTYDNGKIGVAAVKTGKALTVFSGPWQLDKNFIAEILKRAGVFRYITSDDPSDANTRLFVLHARYSGRKHVRLPRRTTVLDVFAKKIIARNADCFETVLNLHETKWFYLGEDADTLLKKIP